MVITVIIIMRSLIMMMTEIDYFYSFSMSSRLSAYQQAFTVMIMVMMMIVRMMTVVIPNDEWCTL